VAQWVRSLDLTTHTNLSPIRRGFTCGFVNYKKGCARLAAASDKVYQLLAHGRWFFLGTPVSSTTKTCCHDIAEILLKVALKHQKSIDQWCHIPQQTWNSHQWCLIHTKTTCDSHQGVDKLVMQHCLAVGIRILT
jgi:hypothetical protein